jgi:hypothetical protein
MRCGALCKIQQSRPKGPVNMLTAISDAFGVAEAQAAA